MTKKAEGLNSLSTDNRDAPLFSGVEGAPIRLLGSSILRGCNIYHRNTVIQQTVDFGGLSGEYSREAGPQFAGQFWNRFFDIRKRIPNSRMNERFLNRLHSAEGAAFEEVLLEAILFVQSSMAFTMHDFRSTDYSQIVDASSPRLRHLVWECTVPGISREAARVGLAGLIELLPDHLHPTGTEEPENFQSAYTALEKRATRYQRSTTTSVILMAAKQRGIPAESIGGPHLRLGQGSAQRMIYASVPSDATLVATQLCRNKWKTMRRLAQLRLPVPKQIRVTSIEESLAAAKTIGYPLVIKPLKGKQASGVTVGINAPGDIPAAFDRANTGDSSVIVESFIPGETFRLLVIGGRFAAALKIMPPTITGDGQKNIGELIDQLNSDPLRNGVRLFKVDIDDELTSFLSRQNLAIDHIPGEGTVLPLRSAANVAVGGVHTDVTDIVQRDYQQLAVQASKGVGLSVAGIDIVTQDISRSYKDLTTAIIEVNARPGLCMHTFPRYGKSRNVGGAVLDFLFPPGVSVGVPTGLVLGDRKTDSIAQDVDRILRASGRVTGLVKKKGICINGRPEAEQYSQQRNALRNLLRDPQIETLVGTVSPRRVVNRGLVLESADAAVIMKPTSDSDTATYRQALDVAMKATTGFFIVSGDNKLALEAMNPIDPSRLILVYPRLPNPTVDVHLAAGGITVVKVREQRQDCIVIQRDHDALAAIPIGMLDAGKKPTARRIETRMLAIAFAFGLGLSSDAIKASTTASGSS